MRNHEVSRIRYFTSIVTSRPNDATQQQRQQAYLRALETIPNLTIHYGHFLQKTKWRPLVDPPIGQSRYVEIRDTEEKGSDVNLATLLLADGYENAYEMAVVITNDSDFALPIETVRKRLGKPIGVIDPRGSNSRQLREAASWYRPLRMGPLGASLFPDTVTDATGAINKPRGW